MAVAQELQRADRLGFVGAAVGAPEQDPVPGVAALSGQRGVGGRDDAVAGGVARHIGAVEREHLVRPAGGRQRRDREFFDRRLVLLPKRGGSDRRDGGDHDRGENGTDPQGDHAVGDDENGNAVDGNQRKRRESRTAGKKGDDADAEDQRPSGARQADEHDQRQQRVAEDEENMIALPEALAPVLTAVVGRTICVHGSCFRVNRRCRRSYPTTAAIADDSITRR
jgi:hypothetical protein